MIIIKIEGLPEGQKITHINVDVTFNDDGEAEVETRHVLDTKNAPNETHRISEMKNAPNIPNVPNTPFVPFIDTSKTTGVNETIPVTSHNKPNLSIKAPDFVVTTESFPPRKPKEIPDEMMNQEF